MLLPAVVTELKASLKERDTLPGGAGALATDSHGPRVSNGLHTPKMNGVGRLDKRQIEQRIEEDRERHKRLKESIWGVSGEGDEEFEPMWEEGSDIGEDDYIVAEEDQTEITAVEAREAKRAKKHGI